MSILSCLKPHEPATLLRGVDRHRLTPKNFINQICLTLPNHSETLTPLKAAPIRA